MKACKVLERLGVTRRTLSSYVRDGKIRVERLGNGFYDYSEEDVTRLEKDIVRENMLVITQEGGIRHEFRLTYGQAAELTAVVTDFLRKRKGQHGN